MPTVEVEATMIKERKADSRGRVALGPEHSGKIVQLAILESTDN